MKTNKLINKYTPKELADAFVFRTKLSAKKKVQANKQLNGMRKKVQAKSTPEQELLARLLQLKYQMEDYSNNAPYDVNRSFGFFLREYLKFLNMRNKDFASDIGIDETELSQVLNRHRKPSEKVIIRLEIHSNKIIPAIIWFKLLEKEKEYEILTDSKIRTVERKHVKNKLQLSI